MAVPTITSVTPNTGPTGGSRLIKVVGTNFQLPPAPPATGPVPVPNPSVEVLFGTAVAAQVLVLSDTLLHVTLPPSAFDLETGPGNADVTVRNIDQSGVVVPGETVTLAGGFTYARPVLERTPNSSSETTLQRVIRTLIEKIRREILNNVTMTVSTDFADQPSAANVAMLAMVPGLVISGPTLRESIFNGLNENRVVDANGVLVPNTSETETIANVSKVPQTVDIEFTLVGVDDGAQRLLALIGEVINFFRRNTLLSIPRVVGSSTYINYRMELLPDGLPRSISRPNDSNIHAFSSDFVIRGVDIDEDEVFDQEVFQVGDAGATFTLEQIFPE